MFESQVINLSSDLNEADFHKQINAESRDSVSTPINKMIYSPKKKMNFAEEMRKSAMRVSQLKASSNSK